MSLTKFDNIIRSALWTSYNNICFYCNRPLDWVDLHIDHIIPESLNKSGTRIKEIIEDYLLDDSFDLNSLSNLVPAHGKCNLRKGDELFPKQTTLFYLGLTNKTLSKIKVEIEKLKKRKNKGQIISKVQSALATNLIDIKELKKILEHAQEENWTTTQLKLPLGVHFIDEIFDIF